MSILANEITVDPLARGYSSMSDPEIAADLSLIYRTRDRTEMSAGEIMDLIDGSEFQALNNTNRARVDRVLGLGAVIIVGPSNAHNAVQELLAAFGAGSATITNLAAARSVDISRAEELEINDAGWGAVQQARAV